MLDPVLRRVFVLTAIVLIVYVLFMLTPVLLPFTAAFMIAYLFSPLVQKLVSFKLPRWLAIAVVFLGIAFAITLTIWFVAPLLWKQLVYARDSIPAGIHWINASLLPWVTQNFNVETSDLDAQLLTNEVMHYVQTNYSLDSVQNIVLRVAQSGLGFLQVGGLVVLIPIIAFYFLLDWPHMLQQMRRLIPRQHEAKTLEIVNECHTVLGAFVKGQFLVMLLLGIVYAVGLQLIGIEVGLIIGMVAGLASIIPYLGFAVGIIAAVIASLFQFGLDWVHLALVAAVFMTGQAIEGYVLQPFLLGDKIGLSPVAVVFAVLAGAQLAGFLGMLIALPVAAVIVVLLRHAHARYEKSKFYALDTTAVPTMHLSNSEASLSAVDHIDVDLETSTSKDASTHYDVR